MTHIADEQLVALALDDLDEAAAAEAARHVEACADCRASLDDVRRVLEGAAAVAVPERDEQYGARVWAALEPRLPARPGQASGGGAIRWRVRPWMAAAAAVLIAVAAFLAGRSTRDAVPTTAPSHARAPHDPGAPNAHDPEAPQAPNGPRVPHDPHAIRERVVLAALGEHLDRTERTLAELVNSDPDARVDISAEQAWARDLLEANRLYRQAARGTPALAQVLDDLEPVLIEIANSPSRLSAGEFESLRARIEERSLLFKVRVTGAELRERQRTFIRAGDKQS